MKERIEETRRLLEELNPVDVYDMYAAEWVLSRPDFPDGNVRDTLKQDIRDRFGNILVRVQEGILGEGMKAMFDETRHLGTETTFTPQQGFQEIKEETGVEFIDTENPEMENHPFLYSKYVKWIIEDIEPEFPAIENQLLNLPERDVKTTIQGGPYVLKVPSIERFFRFIGNLFVVPSWEPNFGGRPWWRITEELYQFWQRYPDNSFSTIDHVIDLAHNTDTWVDKFENDSELKAALEIKFRENSPKDWIDRINDRKVKGGVKRAEV